MESETYQVMCWSAHGRVPKVCVKLCAGKHAGGFRKFAPNYIEGQDKNTPVTKHHETTQYKRLKGEFSCTLARSQQMELNDQFHSSTSQRRRSSCQLSGKHGGHCCQTITYKLFWHRRGGQEFYILKELT
jgi:hypothetical protein